MKLSLSIFLLISSFCLTVYSLSPEKSNIVRGILESQMDKTPKELFKIWYLLFEKKYSFETEEAKQKFRNFKVNLALIKESNLQDLSYKLGLNQFSDMTNEEFKSIYANLKPSETTLDQDYLAREKFLMKEDDDDDLTKRNLVVYNPINYMNRFNLPRDQGSCGGCWAFTTAAALEGNQSIKTNTVIKYLSPQQMIDCSTANFGCQGGSLRMGMNYVLQFGLQYESDYPYREMNQKCSYSNTKNLVKITNWNFCSNQSRDVTRYCNFDKIYNFLSKGPVSTMVDGGTFAFQHYSWGVFNSPCSQINHGVLLIGYGVSTTGIRYYLIRNSWGPYWGENGYIRIQVNDANRNSCFVGFEVVLPII